MNARNHPVRARHRRPRRIRTHLATHAAQAGRIDDLLADPGYLQAAARPQLLAALDAASSATARATADLYRRASGDAVVPERPELGYVLEDQPWYAPSPPETEIIELERLGRLRSRIDAVLMTATETELLAVLRPLRPPPRRRKVLLVHWGPETYYLGRFGECLVAVTKHRMGTLGEGSISLASDQAQRLWSPRAVIMIGLAFGMDRRSQRIANVVVASQVISYEQQRVGSEIVLRGPIQPVNSILLNRFENAPDWRFERPDETRCDQIVGPVLSGDKLIADPDFTQALFNAFPQAVAGEMEGGGLHAAIGRIGTAWILVKAISGWADGRKEDTQHHLAAAAATSFVLHVLSRRNALRDIEKPTPRVG